MKKIKKIFALLIAMVMVLGMSTAVFAQTVHVTDSATNTGKIVISNAANGETYGVIQLFTATVNADGSSIAYTGNIPDDLATYFSKDSAGNITATDAAWNDTKTDMSEGLRTALQSWAEDQTPIKTAVSDGSELTFDQLVFGYYVVTTTQGDTLVSVDSTNPTANIIDKNTTTPVTELSKTVNDVDVNIGQTVTYTVKFKTANYSTENDDESKQIIKYIISDDFADGALTDVVVTSLTIGGNAYTVTTGEGDDAVTGAPQFDANGQIEIPWVDREGKSIYANKAEIVITYTATVAATADIDGEGNTNSVTIDYVDEDGGGSPSEYTTNNTIYTYAVALKKVKQDGTALGGAVFTLPVYVNKTADSDGAYVAIDPTAYAALSNAEKENYTNSLTTPDSDGLIIIKGVASGEYSFTESEAPKGYNKLTSDVKVTATQTGKTSTSTTVYLDKDGNEVASEEDAESTVTVSISKLSAAAKVVVNKTGAELPSTGGIGTTIFYIIGAILVIGAGVVLVTRRRMNAN